MYNVSVKLWGGKVYITLASSDRYFVFGLPQDAFPPTEQERWFHGRNGEPLKDGTASPSEWNTYFAMLRNGGADY